MKKSAFVLGMVVVGLATFIIVQRSWYQKNRAEPAAAEALKAYRDAGGSQAFSAGEWPTTWITDVRTEDGDAGVYLGKAWAPYRADQLANQKWLGKIKEWAASDAPDDQAQVEALLARPELADMEAAGRQQHCQIMGKLIPIADNPIESDLPPVVPSMRLGDLMIVKAQRLAAAGEVDAAQTELQLVLSVGRHLEDDYSLIAYAAGVAIQREGLLALETLWTEQGRTEDAAAARQMADTWESRRDRVRNASRLYEMSLSEEGIAELETLIAADGVPHAFKGEAIIGLSAGHLMSTNGILYGPEDRRREAVERVLQNEDPVLAEIAGKAKASLLRLPLQERMKAFQLAGQLD